eukprot:GFUD01097923.1.p1 GENE.GFUD01097923.1~~GFUD01097923.1.p1  ORF type:complete len:503 (+),score=178.68 GFUD01097923.1:90-1598(+)
MMTSINSTTETVRQASTASTVSVFKETSSTNGNEALFDGAIPCAMHCAMHCAMPCAMPCVMPCAMPGFLSLKELNSLLLKYIGKVQDLECGQTEQKAITIKIDRSEISSLQSKYEDQLEDWKKECADKDSQIADLKAEITKLKAQIKRLKESNASKDGTIHDRDLTIEGLRAEIGKLQANLSMFQNQKEIYEFKITRLQSEISTVTGELNVMTNSFAAEQSRCLNLASRLATLEKELRFKIEVQENKVVIERRKTSIDISSLDTRIQGEYADRLKAELKILRKMYEEHMRVSKDTLERTYKEKISDLELSLAVQMNVVQPTEDLTECKTLVENYKKKIEQLHKNNSDINMQWSKLTVELRDKEASFHAKMSAKEIEMAHLAKLNTEYKRMYEEMRSRLLYDESEVKVYNRLIAPEMDRMTGCKEQVAKGMIRYKNTHRVKFSKEKNGNRSSSSSSDESSKECQVSNTSLAKANNAANKETTEVLTRKSVQIVTSTAEVKSHI